MILRRQSNCFQRSHSTIAVSFFQEYKRHISGFCLSSSGQFGRRNNWVHIIGSGKVKQKGWYFQKLSRVLNLSWKNGKLCNFKFLTDLPLFQSKGKFNKSQLPWTHWFLTKDYSIPPQHLQREEPHPYGSIMHGNRLTISILFLLLQNIHPIYLYFHYSL